MLFARDVHTIDDHAAALSDPARIERMRADIEQGDAYIAKRVFPEHQLRRITDYLSGIGRSSLPNYHPIEPGAPNSHRVNMNDPRSYVRGTFHQFSFYPWNQDVLGLFPLFAPVYRMKNKLSGLPEESFVGLAPERGCAARLSFQFYPSGCGQLNRHADPVDYHQLVVPILLMSQRGVDFQHGGAFLERRDGERIDLEAGDIGDVVYFNAQVCHGVAQIDPHVESDWLSFQGRWMCLFAVNRFSDNEAIADSVDLDS